VGGEHWGNYFKFLKLLKKAETRQTTPEHAAKNIAKPIIPYSSFGLRALDSSYQIKLAMIRYAIEKKEAEYPAH
jgi:hypothetical protein